MQTIGRIVDLRRPRLSRRPEARKDSPIQRDGLAKRRDPGKRTPSLPAALLPPVLLTLAFGLASELDAATYYVRTNGNDASCNGRTDAPFAGNAPNCALATPQACANAVTGPGDQCLFHAGTYQSCPSSFVPFHGETRTAIMKLISKSGTASLRIVFKGIGDGPVVFQAANLGGGNYCDRAIILDASDYVTIGGTGQHEGFIFRGDFDYNRLGQEIDFGTVAVVGAYRSSPTCSSYAKILGNTFEGTTEASLVGETSSEIHFWRASADDCREGAEVAYNNITWRAAQSALGFPDGSSACCSDNGFCEVPASPMQIHHNTMVWNSAHGSYRSNSIGARGLSDVQIYNNWIQNGTPAMQTTQSQTILIRDSKRVSIYNNYIQAYGATNLIYLQHGCYPEATAGVTNESYRIYNNTFYGSADGILLENVQGSEFRNNIFLGSSSQSSADLANAYGKGDFAGPASSGNSFGYTLFHNVNSPWGKSASCAAEFGAASCDPDSTNVYANPVIVGSGAPPVPFFQLQAGSPAIDAGFAGPATPLIDYDGENRGSSPDIGADERGLLLLLPPQNLRIVPPR